MPDSPAEHRQKIAEYLKLYSATLSRIAERIRDQESNIPQSGIVDTWMAEDTAELQYLILDRVDALIALIPEGPDIVKEAKDVK